MAGTELQSHGIDVVHELPGVGENLQDHIGVVSQFACTQPITLHRSASPLRTLLAGVQYLFQGRGDASFPPMAHFSLSHPDKPLPDMQIHYVSVAMQDVHGREAFSATMAFPASSTRVARKAVGVLVYAVQR